MGTCPHAMVLRKRNATALLVLGRRIGVIVVCPCPQLLGTAHITGTKSNYAPTPSPTAAEPIGPAPHIPAIAPHLKASMSPTAPTA